MYNQGKARMEEWKAKGSPLNKVTDPVSKGVAMPTGGRALQHRGKHTQAGIPQRRPWPFTQGTTCGERTIPDILRTGDTGSELTLIHTVLSVTATLC